MGGEAVKTEKGMISKCGDIQRWKGLYSLHKMLDTSHLAFLAIFKCHNFLNDFLRILVLIVHAEKKITMCCKCCIPNEAHLTNIQCTHRWFTTNKRG